MPSKRDQKRFIKRLNADFTVNGVTRKGVSSNFSINGLFIRTNYPYVVDTMLDIDIHLPDGEISRLKGKVVRSDKTSMGKVIGMPVRSMKNGMGIEIIEKDPNYLHLIRDLLD